MREQSIILGRKRKRRNPEEVSRKGFGPSSIFVSTTKLPGIFGRFILFKGFLIHRGVAHSKNRISKIIEILT